MPLNVYDDLSGHVQFFGMLHGNQKALPIEKLSDEISDLIEMGIEREREVAEYKGNDPTCSQFYNNETVQKNVIGIDC